ncbi:MULTISPECIES: TetR/AcrR family transcriptional regulator [unclassified Streptomyces]|uniref:TetR/AcrR family transcriptional regulator n=1 Tax=unclassified Streptomyces TaxID=2593676 RepID=UPI002257AC78|nr:MULTISPECIES: TetR/AcrR family transcriptional regulator [unclassified Streptomyces]MCX4527969.1 TetR/AcrR family transcriptional regulator [Streptomyces sp. NBC_01551]MCX4541416.1 TetR/AcrR family transcriptional regulator [Streptomyces sp. NBC_01565]
MPAARESLLEAAGAALSARPWPAVRMVDVAAAAGVSRQTLYNEFGGKAGLGRALVRREADRYLSGVDRALGAPAEQGERLAAVAEWTVQAARAHPLVRALLTGFWDGNLPVPPGEPSRPGIPALGPGDLTRAVRDRAAVALTPDGGDGDGARQGELALRLALSYVLVPGEEPGIGELVRLLSGPNRTAGGR